jgi:hypothetical protein
MSEFYITFFSEANFQGLTQTFPITFLKNRYYNYVKYCEFCNTKYDGYDSNTCIYKQNNWNTFPETNLELDYTKTYYEPKIIKTLNDIDQLVIPYGLEQATKIIKETDFSYLQNNLFDDDMNLTKQISVNYISFYPVSFITNCSHNKIFKSVQFTNAPELCIFENDSIIDSYKNGNLYYNRNIHYDENKQYTENFSNMKLKIYQGFFDINFTDLSIKISDIANTIPSIFLSKYTDIDTVTNQLKTKKYIRDYLSSFNNENLSDIISPICPNFNTILDDIKNNNYNFDPKFYQEEKNEERTICDTTNNNLLINFFLTILFFSLGFIICFLFFRKK